MARCHHREFIPFPETNVIFERGKASGIIDRKVACIYLILATLRSMIPESFHAAQI